MQALTRFRFLALLLVLEVAYTVYRYRVTDGQFLIGDCPYYAWTTESLVHDRDWYLRNQFDRDLKGHEGFFALASDGRIVTKHPTLLPILSIPFYVLFGKTGFLIVNILLVFAVITGVMLLAGGGPASRWLALAGYLSTPFLAYTYNYSTDVLGTALVVWSFFFALRGRPILSGLLAGLAVWAKVYLALVLLPLALILIPAGWRTMLKFIAAGVIGVLPMLLINAHLFGSPLVTGYDRDARVADDGSFTITEHYSRFNQPLLKGIGNLLFDDKIGMLRTAPLWFLWPIGLWLAIRNRDRRMAAIAMALAIIINVLFFAKYDEWDASLFGNRFLFPALALGLSLQWPLWELAVARFKPSST